MPYKDPIKAKEFDIKWREDNKDSLKKKQKEYAKKNRGRIKEYRVGYYKKNKKAILEKVRMWKETHREEISKQGKEYRTKNADKVKEGHKKYYFIGGGKEKQRKWGKKWRKNNLEHVLEGLRLRRQNDINYKLGRNIRGRLRMALKRGSKAGSAVRDLGCTIPELKLFLEKQFESWMTWDNWTRIDLDKDSWNIDHIIPLTAFDLTDREQFLKACHYSNLKPMRAVDNLSKGNRTDWVDTKSPIYQDTQLLSRSTTN